MSAVTSRRRSQMDSPDSTSDASSDVRAHLARTVAIRFKRITGQPVVVTPRWTSRAERKATIREWANHPICRPYQDNATCIRCRLRHMREANEESVQPPYHRCAFGHTCVLMPLVVNGECVAHCKLALEDDAETNRYLELLDVLAENFSAHLTGQVSSPESPVTNPKHIDPDSHDPIVDPMDDGWTDPVHQALTLIDAEYANPDLTVATVARRLGLNRDYLSHLFRSQTGRRMSRQIFLRRMQQARSMLRSTSLQVRQIALASGFLNTDWFSHTFHELEGVTPSEYRRQSHLR